MQRRTTEDPTPSREPFEHVVELEVGPVQRDGSMTVFPLLARNGKGAIGTLPPLRLFAEALEAGALEVTEVERGSVPWLLVLNRGPEPVLILDGEQVLGARQNRVVSRSILLAPDSRTRIPVSCMEQGRWSEAWKVRSARQCAPAAVRRKGRTVEAQHVARGAPASEAVLREAQHEVWGEISDLSAKLRSSSPTAALDHLFEAKRGELDLRVRAFPRMEGQLGLLAFAGERALGLDAVGSPGLWARVHERFLRGYALDALDASGVRDAQDGRGAGDARGARGAHGPGDAGDARGTQDSRDARDPGEMWGAASDTGSSTGHPRAAGPSSFAGVPDIAAAERFLERVRTARRSNEPTVGMGCYAVLSGSVLGGELTTEGRLVHRSAFPAEEPEGDGYAPPLDRHAPPLGRAYRMHLRGRGGGRANIDRGEFPQGSS